MPIAKVVNAQRDFSGGEADEWIKRSDDHPLLKTNARQAVNWRPLSSRGLANRPGRRVLQIEGPRVEEVVMSPGNNFYLVFGNTYLRVYNAAFTKVFDSGNVMPWTTTTAKTVVWDFYRFSIYMCFDGMQPRVLAWDGVSQVSTWTLSVYAETVSSNNQKRTVFYRLSPLGVTMRPLNVTGSVTVGFSQQFLVSGQVGTRMRFVNRQFLITSVSDPANLVATVEERLFNGAVESTTTGDDLTKYFSIGDEVIGKTTGAKGVVTGFLAGNTQVALQHIDNTAFNGNEVLVGPNGSVLVNLPIHGITDNFAPQATTIWDDEVMNSYRGWPRSCFVDQGRLGFCDFPALPQLIVWSAQGDFNDLYTDANNVGPTNAIQELVPGKSRVLYVVPGAEGSEFVFCDNAVYYIPINQTTPLKPGSVSFNTLMSEGCAQVQPRPVQQSLVYVSAGFTQIKAVQAIGAYNRPYIVDDISELHSHLLKTPIAIAAPGGSDQFEESYFYVANADGSLILCSFNILNGVIDTKTLGWLPWTGAGSATWVSALKGHSDVLITSSYAVGGSIVEQVDATQYLDAALLYNNVPVALTPPGGKGPLWWWAPGASVDVMDGLRMMGTYQVDATGHLVPQNNAGEDFTSPTLTVGQAWTATLEPFIPAVQPGEDVNQRMRKRRVARFEVYVQNSTGFTVCRLEGGPATRTSPAAGTIMQRRRIETWNQDDDPTVAPPLREQSYSFRPVGREHDPRRAIIKDTPGPLTVLEIDTEVTV